MHTCFSGWRRLRLIQARDCYVTPDAAFAAARRAGMDFVCFTDHDTIDGALDFLSRHPEEEPRVIVGEEVEVRLPDSRRWIHLSVFGVDERVHAGLAAAHGDALAVLALLDERRLLFSLNHPFQSFRSIRSARRHLRAILPRFGAVEVCNSTGPRSHRSILEAWLAAQGDRPRVGIGGSDAHTERRIAAAWTAAPGATKADYLASLAAGVGAVGGEALGIGALLGDVHRIIGEYYARLYGWGRRRELELTAGSLLGSIALLPGVVLGVPTLLTALHMARQEWIARGGRWDRADRARAVPVDTGTARPLPASPRPTTSPRAPAPEAPRIAGRAETAPGFASSRPE
jgi:predicted metal-dependent phosphoesterase TrpH